MAERKRSSFKQPFLKLPGFQKSPDDSDYSQSYFEIKKVKFTPDHQGINIYSRLLKD